MRRRSGAIHSETQQQFILLAQKSLNKTGIFYDQRHYTEVQKVQPADSKHGDSSDKKEDPFAQFDFDQVKQFEKDERDLNIQINKKSQINKKYAVICDEVLPIVKMLSYESLTKSDARQVDLVVRKPHIKNATSVTLKYWIISQSIIDTPLAKIYIDSASKIYWISSHQCALKGALQIPIDKFISYLEKQEQKFDSS